jgi:Coenzyme PQQ synthesis protein D (PqqD)
MTQSTLYARTTEIIGTDVDGEVVLLNPVSWNYFELDNIGSAIWALLEPPQSLPSLVEALMVRFTVDQARCLSDAQTFLDALIDHGLVAVVEA